MPPRVSLDFISALGLFSVALQLSACSPEILGENSSSPTTAVTANLSSSVIQLNPPSATLAPGGTQQFTVESADPSMSFSVTGLGSVSPSGLFTAGATPGLTVLTVTDSAGNRAFSIINVTAALRLSGPSGTTLTLVAGRPGKAMVSGGVAPYTFAFKPNSFTGGINIPGLISSSTGTITVMRAGAGKILVSDAIGITQEFSLSVSEGLSLNAPVASNALPYSCEIQFEASGGYAPYAYRVSNVAGAQAVIDATNGTLNTGPSPTPRPNPAETLRESGIFVQAFDSEGNQTDLLVNNFGGAAFYNLREYKPMRINETPGVTMGQMRTFTLDWAVTPLKSVSLISGAPSGAAVALAYGDSGAGPIENGAISFAGTQVGSYTVRITDGCNRTQDFIFEVYSNLSLTQSFTELYQYLSQNQTITLQGGIPGNYSPVDSPSYSPEAASLLSGHTSCTGEDDMLSYGWIPNGVFEVYINTTGTCRALFTDNAGNYAFTDVTVQPPPPPVITINPQSISLSGTINAGMLSTHGILVNVTGANVKSINVDLPAHTCGSNLLWNWPSASDTSRELRIGKSGQLASATCILQIRVTYHVGPTSGSFDGVITIIDSDWTAPAIAVSPSPIVLTGNYSDYWADGRGITATFSINTGTIMSATFASTTCGPNLLHGYWTPNHARFGKNGPLNSSQCEATANFMTGTGESLSVTFQITDGDQ